MNEIPQGHPLYQTFAGAAEQAFFGEIGLADCQVVDYLTAMLVRFLREDALHRLPGDPAIRVDGLAEMLLIAERAERSDACESADRSHDLFRHVGDATLFVVGMFPEAVRVGAPRLRDELLKSYAERGRRSYRAAGERVDRPDQSAEALVLRRIADEYEVCAEGLRIVRKSISPRIN